MMKRYLMPILLFAVTAILVDRGISNINRDPEAPLVASNIGATERTEILKLSAEVLSHSVCYRGDGTASTTYLGPQQRTDIEWRGLVVRQLVAGTVSEADLESGVNRRFYAQIHATSFRTLRGGRWSAWKSGLCPFFPGYIVIDDINGELKASAPQLAKFLPGPTVNENDPTRPLMPHERAVASR